MNSMSLVDYFSIQHYQKDDDLYVFYVQLNPDFCVYAGHFPQRAIAPGVCQIEMIKRCAQVAIGKELFISYVKQCRFLELITPQTHNNLKLSVFLTLVENVYTVKAEIRQDVLPLVSCTIEMIAKTT
jgi:3-hydroxyacyl-[acyl-carrier-protein] dehydratase